jgi:predicted DNA-binding protein
MSRKKSEFKNVVSFRLSPEEKESLERVTQLLKTTKSEFLRDWINRLLTIVKN